MSKRIGGTFVALSLIICFSGLETGRLSPAIAGEREIAAQNSKTPNVEISFEGLMVLSKQQANGRYEIGILTPKLAHQHTFKILIDGKKVPNIGRFLAKGGKWILEVTYPEGGAGRAGTTLRDTGHRGRLKDSEKGQFDFSCWAVDLESDEFHDRLLTLKPGYLKPIIQLPDGEFLTKYKAPMVQRKKGKGEFSDFGFVAETAALVFALQPGQELVLRVEKTGREGEVFRLKYGKFREVSIQNPPDMPSKISHFKLYYGLFSNVPDDEKYDFRIKEPKVHPINEYPISKFHPHAEKAWVDSLPCGKVLLGRRTAPLE
jgi:hypothetical protein